MRVGSCFLRSLSDGTGFGNFPARLGTAPARFGRFSHRFHVGVFSAFGRASITDVCAKGAELVRKLGIRRQQPCGQTTYWCAFAAKASGSCHSRRVICERCIDAGRAPVQALQAVFNCTLYDRIWGSCSRHEHLLLKASVTTALAACQRSRTCPEGRSDPAACRGCCSETCGGSGAPQ